MQKFGSLIIISAPSGAGKTTLANALVKKISNLKISTSYTTRPKRCREAEGKSYKFISEKKFQKMVEQNIFLEHSKVFGHQYGTAKEWVESTLRSGTSVILEIDWRGAQKIRGTIKNTLSIFILPPSKKVLQHRLMNRGQDATSTIEHRMQQASNEISHCHEYDHFVVNDIFENALNNLVKILITHKTSNHTEEVLIT